eukprot:TRINITY_DN3914_c0_g1_i1.p1 TRINITY_DN3914_c0_g1~~TRINITY_DN3914_c0_g1_i1.p1  ORF type:complete len:247 (+),score=90.29 TRINITY_DN3914_c0_g1_i1:53-742(+)
MHLQWTAILFLGVAEAILCSLFILPAPVSLLKSLISLVENPNYKRGSKIVFSVVGFLFLGSLLELFWHKRPEGAGDHEHHYEINQVESYKNAVLTASSILLYFILNRLAELTKNNLRMTIDTEFLKKQATQASTQYMKLLDSKDADSAASSLAKEKTANTPEQQIETLKAQLLEAEKAKKAAETNAAAVKKQAENQQESYQTLLKENASLKNQVKDYDFMFADQKKKNI